MSISRSIRTFRKNRKGAAAAEYALILAIVAAAIATAAFSLGGAVKTSIDGATTELQNCYPGNTSGCTTTTTSGG